MSEELMAMIESLVQEHYGTQGLEYLRQRTSPAPTVQVPEGAVWSIIRKAMRHGAGLSNSCATTADFNAALDAHAAEYERQVTAMLAAAPAPAPVATEPVAQGGGVDVEKVMALVEQYANERRAEWSEVPPFSAEARMAADDARTQIRALLASPAASGWVAVSDRLPFQEIEVLAFYKDSFGNIRRVRAFYAPKHTVEHYGDEEDCCDYDETTDTAWLEEGWYECISNWGEYSSVRIVEGEVTHWMRLPEPPAIANQEAQDESQ